MLNETILIKYKVDSINKYAPQKFPMDGKIWKFLGNAGKWVKAVVVAFLLALSLPSTLSALHFCCHQPCCGAECPLPPPGQVIQRQLEIVLK